MKKKSTWGGARPNSGGKRPNAGRKPHTLRINVAEACLLSESLSEMALTGKLNESEMNLGLELSEKLLKFVRARDASPASHWSRIKSERKAKSSAANGRKGGRPKKAQ